MIHVQRENVIENEFDLIAGLKYVNQLLFRQDSVTSVSILEIQPLIKESFTNGSDVIMKKLKQVSRNGRIDRVELNDLIESLETKQIYGDAR